MRTWTLAYQYSTLTFVVAANATGNETMDDSDLQACFEALIAGTAPQHLRVLCRRGLRRVVQYCTTHYIYVRAAGGMVQAPDGLRLLIRRNERWDLPKGGVEQGETLRQAAVREVMEETGMHHLAVQQLITKTYHLYNLYGGWHLKQTSWYAMTVPHPYPIHTQQEEGITEGEWVSAQTFEERLSTSYATLQAVAARMPEDALAQAQLPINE